MRQGTSVERFPLTPFTTLVKYPPRRIHYIDTILVQGLLHILNIYSRNLSRFEKEKIKPSMCIMLLPCQSELLIR